VDAPLLGSGQARAVRAGVGRAEAVASGHAADEDVVLADLVGERDAFLRGDGDRVLVGVDRAADLARAVVAARTGCLGRGGARVERLIMNT
jgi:hypothetical protein